ncbi:PhyH-domain-containing protein, partial [Aureobasidium melanogenum]
MSPHADVGMANGQKESQTTIPSRLYTVDHLPKVSSLADVCNRSVSKKDYQLAYDVQKNIPIYDLAKHDLDKTAANILQDEWYEILANGPGVFVVQNMYQDQSVLDATNAAFRQIIEREKSNAKGDHFGHGKNERIWNSFSKHGLQDPKSFVQYYSNPWLARVCEAWLGQQYRVTAQTNIVKPGGAAQVSHRDYHLGFQTAEGCSRFPKGMQYASQFLTLQGAVAQSDMPLESGPTRFLPFSQKLDSGYMAYRQPEFDQYFNEHWVSLPLKKGDGVFFNPALHHAAGNNTSDVDRSANLLQISSAFGKPMEQIDAIPLVKTCWPEI